MTKLAQTLGLTEFQSEIIATVRQFVEKEGVPNAPELERTDTYPQAIVDQMREMGLFGLMIPQEYGGLGESLLTYALCVEELARGWMSISGVINTHFIVAYMLRQHGTNAQQQRLLPRMATGEVRGAFSMSEPELGSDVAAIRTRAARNADGTYTYTLNNTDPDTNALAQGQQVTDQFTYTMTDANGATSSATLTVTITGTNDLPVANVDTADVSEQGVDPGPDPCLGRGGRRNPEIGGHGRAKSRN